MFVTETKTESVAVELESVTGVESEQTKGPNSQIAFEDNLEHPINLNRATDGNNIRRSHEKIIPETRKQLIMNEQVKLRLVGSTGLKVMKKPRRMYQNNKMNQNEKIKNLWRNQKQRKRFRRELKYL